MGSSNPSARSGFTERRKNDQRSPHHSLVAEVVPQHSDDRIVAARKIVETNFRHGRRLVAIELNRAAAEERTRIRLDVEPAIVRMLRDGRLDDDITRRLTDIR